MTVFHSSKFSPFKLVTYNCRGAMNNGLYIRELIQQSDIICLQEHLLSRESVSFLDTLCDNTRCYTKCASYVDEYGHIRRKGGVSIMWKLDMDCVVHKLEDIGNERIIVVKLSPPSSRPLYIMNVYLPSINHNFDEYSEHFGQVMEIHQYLSTCGHVLIAGDINTSINVGER